MNVVEKWIVDIWLQLVNHCALVILRSDSNAAAYRMENRTGHFLMVSHWTPLNPACVVLKIMNNKFNIKNYKQGEYVKVIFHLVSRKIIHTSDATV